MVALNQDTINSYRQKFPALRFEVCSWEDSWLPRASMKHELHIAHPEGRLKIEVPYDLATEEFVQGFNDHCERWKDLHRLPAPYRTFEVKKVSTPL